VPRNAIHGRLLKVDEKAKSRRKGKQCATCKTLNGNSTHARVDEHEAVLLQEMASDTKRANSKRSINDRARRKAVPDANRVNEKRRAKQCTCEQTETAGNNRAETHVTDVLLKKICVFLRFFGFCVF